MVRGILACYRFRTYVTKRVLHHHGPNGEGSVGSKHLGDTQGLPRPDRTDRTLQKADRTLYRSHSKVPLARRGTWAPSLHTRSFVTVKSVHLRQRSVPVCEVKAPRRRGEQEGPSIEGSIGFLEGSVVSFGSGESLGVPQVFTTHRTLAVRPVAA